MKALDFTALYLADIPLCSEIYRQKLSLEVKETVSGKF